MDLHGIFLSADFAATFEDGVYRHIAGTVWMASDGGIFLSNDGGRNFHSAIGINTLSCVNIAGVALPGKGPVISLNTGDNDGYTSSDGGATWRPQNYGGGDNDCSYADPLRPHSMLVFTPRRDEHGKDGVASSVGQTVTLYEADQGELPDLGSSDMRHVVPGPSLRPKSRLWNANSGFALRGFRPIVLNMTDDPADAPGDYVFIRYFGNYTDRNVTPNIVLPDNLAILLRTRRIRDIEKRKDWDTPGSWRVEKHPRLLGNLTGTGGADVVGFGDDGVWTALGNGDGTFKDPQFVLADLGFEAGGWRVDKHPRLLADLRGNGRSDIVAFGDAGVYVALSNGDGTFTLQCAARRAGLRPRPGAGASTAIPASCSTSTTMALPTSWASATTASTSRSATATARSTSRRSPCSTTLDSMLAAGVSTAIRASSRMFAASAASTSSASATTAFTSRSATAMARSISRLCR